MNYTSEVICGCFNQWTFNEHIIYYIYYILGMILSLIEMISNSIKYQNSKFFKNTSKLVYLILNIANITNF